MSHDICCDYSINDMVYNAIAISTANVLYMSKCVLCHPEVHEIIMWLSHRPGLGVYSSHVSFFSFFIHFYYK